MDIKKSENQLILYEVPGQKRRVIAHDPCNTATIRDSRSPSTPHNRPCLTLLKLNQFAAPTGEAHRYHCSLAAAPVPIKPC